MIRKMSVALLLICFFLIITMWWTELVTFWRNAPAGDHLVLAALLVKRLVFVVWFVLTLLGTLSIVLNLQSEQASLLCACSSLAWLFWMVLEVLFMLLVNNYYYDLKIIGWPGLFAAVALVASMILWGNAIVITEKNQTAEIM